jgi:hypothetical protein
MSKPDYFAIAEQLKTETDPVIRAQLVDQLYTFTEVLTEEEKALFGFFDSGYIENDPGYIAETFSSYIGKYYGPNGEIS